MSASQVYEPLPAAAESTRAALDQLDELRAAMSAVADLVVPEKDLHCVDRNNLAMLLGLLLRLQGQATQDAWAGLQAMRAREAEGAKLADLAAIILAQERKKPAPPEGGEA